MADSKGSTEPTTTTVSPATTEVIEGSPSPAIHSPSGGKSAVLNGPVPGSFGSTDDKDTLKRMDTKREIMLDILKNGETRPVAIGIHGDKSPLRVSANGVTLLLERGAAYDLPEPFASLVQEAERVEYAQERRAAASNRR